MSTAFLIMLREGFEAALIVAIVLAYLRKIDRLDLKSSIWVGVVAAAALAVLLGVVVHLTVGALEGEARLRVFAAISMLAAAVLTWMIFWMRKQSRMVKSELEHAVDHALDAQNARTALVGVAFLAVLREGIEAALFLIAAATDEGGQQVVVGALIGMGLACVLAYLVYLGGQRLPMRTFFEVTGVILIVFAAGLVSKAVLLLQISGDLGSFDLNGVYDVRSVHWLTQESEIGKMLGAITGWDPRPSIEQVVVWLGYAIPTLYLFLRRGSSLRAPRGTAPDTIAVLQTEAIEPTSSRLTI